MREIKFRGKRKGEPHEWLIGDLNHFHGGVYILPRQDGVPLNGPDWNEVIPETVGQYTGLKDKDGKEIWEEDILKKRIGLTIPHQFTYSYVVWYKIEWRTYFRKNMPCTTCDCKQPAPIKRNISDFEEAEVIGNIHDNPELLKNGTT